MFGITGAALKAFSNNAPTLRESLKFSCLNFCKCKTRLLTYPSKF